jgi:hypothetical protein
MTYDDNTDASRICWFCGKRIVDEVYFNITVGDSLKNFHAVCLFSYMGEGERNERSRIARFLNKWQILLDTIKKDMRVHK